MLDERIFSLIVPGEPVAKGRHRTGRWHAYTPKKTRDAQNKITVLALGAGFGEPLLGPLIMRVEFVFRIPPSWTKWKREAARRGMVCHTGKPDLDNVLKLVKDGLTKASIYKDDSQVMRVEMVKAYCRAGEEPRTLIKVHQALHVSNRAEWLDWLGA